MRQQYGEFRRRGAEVVVVAPESPAVLRSYWEAQQIPYAGLADPAHQVAQRYGQQVRLLRLGRLPALLVIDREGKVRYAHYGQSMRDIPENEEVLRVLDELEAEGRQRLAET